MSGSDAIEKALRSREGRADRVTLPTRKDFVSDQEVRWCPGCGDYSILAQVQRTLPEIGVAPEDIVFVAGIGCSSRFPYYMNTYGFHGIHGRSPAIATGIKAARPELEVWVVTGDGDALAIGGNHLIHALRRNVGIKILLFENRIYGLTKGQASPTSELGKRTKSTPLGSVDHPFSPMSLALGANATFLARAIDTDAKYLQAILRRVASHKGSAFVEIFQNCVVFNDDAFVSFADRKVRDDRTLMLEHGERMLFAGGKKGIAIDRERCVPVVVDVESEKDLELVLVHDEAASSSTLAFMLARLEGPDFPVPLGILRAVERPTYEDLLEEQGRRALARHGEKTSLEDLLNAGETWVVE